MGVKEKVYRKHNSFVDIRRGAPNGPEIHDRLGRLFRETQEHEIPEPERHLFQQLREDLLGDRHPGGGIRFEIHSNVEEEIKRISQSDLLRYLLYRYRYEIYPQRKTLADFPPCLQIEPASVCNYRCVFCYQTDTAFTRRQNGHMGMMSLELFKSLIDQAEGRCEAMTLASRGEPLICRNIEPMLAYCQGKFLGFKMNTNAWFLDEAKAHAILQSGMNTLVFSADAAAEPQYSQFRVGGKLDRVVANIQKFQEIRAAHYPNSKLITRVSGVKFREEQDLDEMERFWGRLVDQVAFVNYNPWENVYSRPANSIVAPCSDLWRRMFVWFDGTVNPCDVDYRSTLAVGNAGEHPLSTIWQSEAYNRLREAHLSDRRCKISPCSQCTAV